MGKGYEMESGTGLALWREVTARLSGAVARRTGVPARAARVGWPIGRASIGPATTAALDTPRFGFPTLVTPRLGQGSFRVLVTDAYRYRCSMTGERTLPVLEAAHIRPYADGGEHALSNGLLLRSDLHTLFDLGYVAIDPKEKRILVSDRIKAEFENGREYYKLRGERLVLPENPLAIPSIESLTYHAEKGFEGDPPAQGGGGPPPPPAAKPHRLQLSLLSRFKPFIYHAPLQLCAWRTHDERFKPHSCGKNRKGNLLYSRREGHAGLGSCKLIRRRNEGC